MSIEFSPLENKKSIIISYFTLRKIIGGLGFLLPIVCLICSYFVPACEKQIHKSISDYYFTPIRDVFVGILCVVAFFLFAYKGNGKLDNRMATLAGVFALGIAFFPTSVSCPIACNLKFEPIVPWASKVHFPSALGFFGILIYFCLFSFQKNDPGEITNSSKNKQNQVYKFCGYTMLACIIGIGIYFGVYHDKQELCDEFPICLNVVFWLETIALAAFGYSWTTKGKFVWNDINPLKLLK